MTKKELTKIVKEALSAWDAQQADKKKKAEEYRKQRDEKIKVNKFKGADSSMKITKEHLTRIVKEAVEEVEGESWWDKKKKELEDKKKEKSDDGEVKKEELSITKEHLMKIIREEVEKLMEEPQVSSGVQGAGEEEDKGEHYQPEVMEEADSVEDQLRCGSQTRETETYSETPPRTLKESKKSVLLARPKGR